MKKLLSLFVTLLCIPLYSEGSWLVGGYIATAYEASGSSHALEVRLHVLINKANISPANYSLLLSSTQQVVVGAQSDNHLIEVLDLAFIQSQPVSFTNPVCAQLRALDYEFLVYTLKKPVENIHLDETAGLYFSWEKCCFNNLLFNLNNPGNSSMILYSESPPLLRNGEKINYTSPVLKDWQATYACLNLNKKIPLPFEDEDILEISLIPGYKGDNTNLLRPRPYDTQDWATGYSLSNPSPGPVPMRPYSSDVLEMEGNSSGLFSFTVAVTEKKNNVRTGLTHFVFQMPLTACNYPDAPTADISFDDLTSSPKTICQAPLPAITNLTGNYSYQWKINDVPIPGETGPQISITQAGIYTLEVNDNTNCTRESNSNVLVVNGGVLQESIRAEKERICEGEQIILRSRGNAEVDWYEDNNFIMRAKEITVSTSGRYRILSPNTNCTRELDNKLIDAYTFPSPSYSPAPTENELCVLSPILLRYPGLSHLEYAWFKDHNPITGEIFSELSVNTSGLYYLMVSDPLEGCTLNLPDFLIIDGLCNTAPDYVIPNAFSPNNDGFNDFLEFKYVSAEFLNARVTLYNRWGIRLLESAISDLKWDGGENPPGVYLLEIIKAGKTDTISITLLK